MQDLHGAGARLLARGLMLNAMPRHRPVCDGRAAGTQPSESCQRSMASAIACPGDLLLNVTLDREPFVVSSKGTDAKT